MEQQLAGRSAIVVGGSKGIGLAIAQDLTRAGARVMVVSRKESNLEQARAVLPEGSGFFAANAADPEAAEAGVRRCLELFGAVDILVNGAGTNPYAGRLIDAPLETWDKTFQVNVRGPLAWTQQACRQWMSEHRGSIVNVASNAAFQSGGPLGTYALSKSALLGMTRHLASELGPEVRVNAVAPGLVQTDFARMLWEPAGTDAVYGWPMQRIGQPGDVAQAVTFLVSDAASWITGATLVIDGGYLTSAGIGEAR